MKSEQIIGIVVLSIIGLVLLILGFNKLKNNLDRKNNESESSKEIDRILFSQ